MSNKKRVILIFSVIFIILFALSFYFDAQISRGFESLRGMYLSTFFLGVNFLNNEIIITAFLTLILLWGRKKREWILPLWVTIFLTAALSVVLKVLVHRPRPFAAGIVSLLPGIAAKASYFTWDFSFPSFDSAFIFCTIPIISKFFPRLKYLWIAFAALIALSRVFLGVHYMSDVLAGGVLGYGVGLFILWIENRNSFFGKIYNKISGKK
ncbi:MAG: phosphatase PAP2 family protein [Nanoarchaeota archaeon]|nr:phosphatase PAP2 family protein [Nanoarchaeota archaeon]